MMRNQVFGWSLCLLMLVGAAPSGAVDYEVGPGQALTAIGDVPWESLAPGDRVLIHWRDTPYREKWVICRRGTQAEPIVVSGVPGPGGELPVISGEDAVTPAPLSFWNDTRGVIKIGGANTPSDLLPAWIILENLDVRSGRPPYTFTDEGGGQSTYSDNAAAIYVEKAEHLIIRGCMIHDSGNGLFIGVNEGQTQDVLIDGNWVFDNGLEGSIYQHNSYTSALGITFQFNHYGPLRTGCDGNNLKDRSAGLVVRYNWIESGNRQLDLVDGEDHPSVVNDPRYGETFVYGNILVEPDGAGNSQIVHYGGDSGTLDDYRKGTLYFFHNTVVSTRSGNTTLLRLSTIDEHADVRNNIVYATAGDGYLAMLSSDGVLDLSYNWMTQGWVDSHSGLDGVINDDNTGLEGTEPGFVDGAGQDFELAAGSPCIDTATTLPGAALPDHELLSQYVVHRASVPRPVEGPPDLGAFERCSSGTCPSADASVDPPLDSGVDPTPDSGVDPSTDGGTGDPDGSDDGCGCQSTGPAGSGGLLLLLLVGLLLRRRRQRNAPRGQLVVAILGLGLGSGLGLTLGACSADDGAPPAGSLVEPTRFDLHSAGPDCVLVEAACGVAEMPADCDPCEALGYYGDLVCDQPLIDAEICDGPDPDCTVTAGDIYVAPDGDDANPGTEGSPLATLQAGLDMAQPGSLVYLRGGTFAPTEQTRFRLEGTEAAPIVVRAYPGEAVIIDASGLPDGDLDGASTPTWNVDGAKHLAIVGPIHLTNGRGAAVVIQEDTHFVDFVHIEASYNGQRASRAGHGYNIVEDEWADVESVRFINCDAHHNANHRAREGEDVADNQYQHGDGWRIKSGRNVELWGCRAWNNLDDNYDLVWAADPILLVNTWSAAAGKDDAAGTITGTPGYEAEWGEGIKLGYDSDTGQHMCVRCLSWDNVHLGFRMDGGPNQLLHCGSFRNGRRALGWDLGSRAHVIRNSLDFDTYRESDIPSSTDSQWNTWDADTGVTVTADDFLSVDPSGLLGPRQADGSLPVTDFLRLATGSDLIDAGTDVGLPFGGAAPDLGCFESF